MKKIKISISLTEQETYEALRCYVESQYGVVMPDDIKSITMHERDGNTVILEWESSNTALVQPVSPGQQTS